MTVVGVIPARYGSSRFPGKVLADIHGKPMVQHVYERAKAAGCLDRIIVATEDPRVVDAVRGFGGSAVLTSPDHPSGTDRVAEAVEKIDADIIVNVQGDEPMMDPLMIDEVVDLVKSRPEAGMATLVKTLTEDDDIHDPGVVKVVTDAQGMAIYFSRSVVPYARFKPEGSYLYEHIGLYGYRRDALMKFRDLGPSRLELIEGLEQIRALEHQIAVAVRETASLEAGYCVDTPADLERVRTLLAVPCGGRQ